MRPWLSHAPQRQLSFLHQGGQNTGPALPLLFLPSWPVASSGSWLNAVAKTGHATCEQVVLRLEFGDSGPDVTSVLREELIGHLTRGESLTKNSEEVFCGFASQAQQDFILWKTPTTTKPGLKGLWLKG